MQADVVEFALKQRDPDAKRHVPVLVVPNFLEPSETESVEKHRENATMTKHGFESRKAVAGGASTPSTVSSHR